MHRFAVLFRCLAFALCQNGLKAMAQSVPFGPTLYEIAESAFDEYRRRCNDQETEARLRADLEALAQSTQAEVHQVAAEAVRATAANQSAEVQATMTTYLCQVPAAVRQPLRRRTDPDGHTVPAHLPLRRGEDLLRFLPDRLPRFKPGDQPLAVDRELVELLGVGGFGEVWMARNPYQESEPPVALKFCLDKEAARTLPNEARLLDRVKSGGQHPGIVSLRNTYLRADPPCLEYEYVVGGDLAGLILEWHANSRKPTAEQASKVLLRLATIVAHAHALGIVHRDLKPSNVLVQRAENNEIAYKIADFGIGGLVAKQALGRMGLKSGSYHVTGKGDLTKALRGAHTPLYASPQQIRGDDPDARDDIYALGVIWYQLLKGDMTLGAPSGSKWMEELAGRGMCQDTLKLLVSCVEPDQKHRPRDAGVLATKLQELLEPPLWVEPVHPRNPARPTLRTGLFTSGLLAVMGLILVVLFGWSRWGSEPPVIWPSGMERQITNSINMKLSLIPAGKFLMGSPKGEASRSDDEEQHEVEITQPFYIGTYEVTQEEYEKVMGTNPSWFQVTGVGKDKLGTITDTKRFPVGMVSHDMAKEFCRKLSELPEEKRSGRVYRLPTEAEWEYTCRGGSTQNPFTFKSPSLSASSLQANFNGRFPYGGAAEGKYLERTTTVGSYEANPFGVFDMHGNVWEWCEDWYGKYDSGPIKDPKGPQNGDRRVLRGGSWNVNGGYCRSANRVRNAPDSRDLNVGFRVVVSGVRAP